MREGLALGHTESEPPRVGPGNPEGVFPFSSPQTPPHVDTLCLSVMMTKAFLPRVTWQIFKNLTVFAYPL